MRTRSLICGALLAALSSTACMDVDDPAADTELAPAVAHDELAAQLEAAGGDLETANIVSLIPPAPNVPPRFYKEEQFTREERTLAVKAWNLAVKYAYYTRWFVSYMAVLDEDQQRRAWQPQPGDEPFFGDVGEGRPSFWFGAYRERWFDDVDKGTRRIWEKFEDSGWKMKRQNCVGDHAANVIVLLQIRLCDGFFRLSNGKPRSVSSAARLLVHEMAHHISVSWRQIKDIHTAPIPDCTGDYNACYGRDDARYLAKHHTKHAAANNDNYAFFAQSYYEELAKRFL